LHELLEFKEHLGPFEDRKIKFEHFLKSKYKKKKEKKRKKKKKKKKKSMLIKEIKI